MNQRRLLMATDIPFWRRSTGAEQRIASLMDYLKSESIQIRVMFLASTSQESSHRRDLGLIAQQKFDIEFRSSDQPPSRMAKRITWHAGATLNQLKQWSPKTRRKQHDEPTRTPLKIKDFHWPWALTAFKEMVKEFQPTSILIEYIKLAYLLDALTPAQRKETHCLIDTHDVLHRRAQEFSEHGFQHWISIDRVAEADLLKRFDTILAIQKDEAALFREMAPEVETIVCGHVPAPRRLQPRRLPDVASDGFKTESSKSIANPRPCPGYVVGYLGSANDSNAESIAKFLETAWESILDSEQGDAWELVIAGKVCESLDRSQTDWDKKRVRILGELDDVETFYDGVDVVVNPVAFGSGLKIKNCEAISFGIPLLTTQHGWVGMSETLKPAVRVCATLESMAQSLLDLAAEPSQMLQFKAEAAKLSQTEFLESQTYSELRQSIFRGK